MASLASPALAQQKVVESIEVRVVNADVVEASFRSKPMIFDIVIDVVMTMRGGESTISVAAVDAVSNLTGGRRVHVVIH